MRSHLEEGWRLTAPPTEPPVQPQHQGERTRNQPQIVEVGMQEGTVQVRLEEEAIDPIRRAAQQKQRIAMEAERLHSCFRNLILWFLKL